jgi:hypothetical protein
MREATTRLAEAAQDCDRTSCNLLADCLFVEIVCGGGLAEEYIMAGIVWWCKLLSCLIFTLKYRPIRIQNSITDSR